MSESTSRIVLTVAISLGILLAWSYFFAPKQAPQKNTPTAQGKTGQQKTSAAPSAEKIGAASQPSSQPTSQPALKPGEGPRSATVEGKHTTLAWKGGNSTITFTDSGATLRHVVLKNERYKELRNGQLRQVDLVQTARNKGPWPLMTVFPGSDFVVPVNARFTLAQQKADGLTYTWESAKVEVTKQYRLDPKRPVLWMELSVRNKTKRALRERLVMKLFSRQDPTQAAPGMTNPYPKVPTGLCHINGEIHRRSQGAISGSQSGCSAAGCGMGSGMVSQVGDVRWMASDDRYFMVAVVPRELSSQRRCDLRLRDGQPEVIEAALTYPEKTIGVGATLRHRFIVYLGAKDLAQLDKVQAEDKSDLALSESIEFGWFAMLCRPMLALLKFFYSFLGNWGLAIILLTLVVKLLTLYWTHKSMKSMRGMQRLKPHMDVLKEKYGDDKNRLNQEMMALYRTHKVNPLGGCLPMLLQMPVWFALYRTLGNAQELYRSEFIFWINDLTAPDRFYVLPIAMGLSMFAQQMITPQTLEGAQAKMMKYFMPGMFTFMMLWLPAGLTLYIFINTLLSMAHQWHINRSDPMPTEPPKVELETKPSGGRPPRGKRATGSTAAAGDESATRTGGKSKKRRRKKKS